MSVGVRVSVKRAIARELGVSAARARLMLTARANYSREHDMRGIFRGLLAGWGASKLGGGCISTIIIFLILYWLLGKL